VLRLLLGAGGKEGVGARLSGLVGTPLCCQQALSRSAVTLTWITTKQRQQQDNNLSRFADSLLLAECTCWG
jgi:hypothetical protein